MMMNRGSIIKWFGAPEFARVDLRARARTLWLISWPFFVVITVMLALAVVVEPETLVRRATTVAAVGSLITVLHMTSRAGRPVLASWILVIGLSVVVTQRAWVTGGIHAPVGVFYAFFVVMAGALLGLRGAVATAALCILGASVLTVGTTLGQTVPRPGAGSPVAALVLVMLAIGIALLLATSIEFRAPSQGLDVDAVHLLVADMRSPMQVLLSRLELLRRELRGESARDAEAALDGVRVLRRMTNGLLDLSRLQSERMPIRRTVADLSGLVDAVVSAALAQASCNVTLGAQGDSACRCDPDLTRRIVEILVTNALRRTPTGGQVRVRVAGSRRRVSVAIADDGPRAPAEASGFGLAFCRLAAEAQGGTFCVEDGVPRGNVFVLELPR